MPITIELSEAEERILRARAANYGQTLEAFAAKVLTRESRAKSFDEVLEPFRRSFEESGMTEEDLAALVEEAREEIYQEKHGIKK